MPTVKDYDLKLAAYVPAYLSVGKPLPEQVTLTNINRIRKRVGLDWEPAVEPQFRKRALGPGFEAYDEVEGMRYITRGPGGRILGQCTNSYQLFGNDELFGIAEAVGQAALDDGHEVTFIHGGEIHGGKHVFLLADLGAIELPGDPAPHSRFMTLLSSHNGGGAVKVLGGDFRWSCTNALRLVELDAKAKDAAFSFRHTSQVSRRVEDSRKALTAAMLQLDRIEAHTRELLGRRITPERASDYLAQFALAQVVSKADPQREHVAGLSTARENAVHATETALMAVLGSSTCEKIRDTAYGPVAAVIEYLDNVRPAASADTRLNRSMFVAERGKKLAVSLIGKHLF